MDSRKFCEELRKLMETGKYRAYITKTGKIRLCLKEKEGVTFCPLTAVIHAKTGKRVRIMSPREEGRMLGFDNNLMAAIFEGADEDELFRAGARSAEMRDHMLKALGIT